MPDIEIVPRRSPGGTSTVAVPRIDSVEISLSRVPLPEGPWGDQIHRVTDIEVTVVDIRGDNGLVGTVLELGFAWAAYGLKLGTTALEQTSKTLDLAAHSLDKLSTEFAKKSRVQVAASSRQ